MKVGDGGGPRLLFIDPYLTHSHRAFQEGMVRHVPARWTVLGLPGRFFRWRMRGAPAYLATAAREHLESAWDGMVVSSMLNLAELRGLVPNLCGIPAVVVFHENQMAYPAPGMADQMQLDRDTFLAFTNLTSAMAAHRVVFNSEYHRAQFLEASRDFLGRLPDARPQGLVEAIEAKSLVLPIPLETTPAEGLIRETRRGALRIVWNHRWDHDKDPEQFFEALVGLAAQDLDFRVAVLGPRAASWPEVFNQAGRALGGRLECLGPEEDRRAYWKWLFWADLVVSTARQEYFGLSVAEAVWAGCRPLVPDALVYPDLYPPPFRYPPGHLTKALRPLVEDPSQVRSGAYSGLVSDLTWRRQAGPWKDFLWEAFGLE